MGIFTRKPKAPAPELTLNWADGFDPPHQHPQREPRHTVGPFPPHPGDGDTHTILESGIKYRFSNVEKCWTVLERPSPLLDELREVLAKGNGKSVLHMISEARTILGINDDA